MDKKTMLIVAVIVVAALLYYFSGKKGLIGSKDLSTADTETPFDIDDTAAYNQMRGLFDAESLAWIDEYVRRDYTAGKYKIGARKSKALTFLRVTGAATFNKEGKFTDNQGRTVLWPQETFNTMWGIMNELSAKYNNL